MILWSIGAHDRSCRPAILVVLRSFALICCGHRAVALENLALRQTVGGVQARGPASATPSARSTVLAAARSRVAELAFGLDRRATRDGGRLASAMAPTAMDPPADVRSSWPAPHRDGHSDARRRRDRPPSQTWRTFPTNHVTSLVSMDFFTVPTLNGRALFVLVLLAHHRRRIVHVAITKHPTGAWTAQQVIEAFPNDNAPRWLLRDRDAIYGDVFPAPCRQHGPHGGHHQSLKSLAQPVCGETDRIHSARVSALCDRPRRAASATPPDRVPHLLSWGAKQSRLGEGRPDDTKRSAADRRTRGRVPGSWRIASSLRTACGLTGIVDCRLDFDVRYVFAGSDCASASCVILRRVFSSWPPLGRHRPRPATVLAKDTLRFPSVLLQPLGHLSVSLESVVYGPVDEPENPNCVRNCVRPPNVLRSPTATSRGGR